MTIQDEKSNTDGCCNRKSQNQGVVFLWNCNPLSEIKALYRNYYIRMIDFEVKLLFCFVCGFTSHWRIFHSNGDVIIIGEWLETYAWHSWPLSSEGSLTCHTYCDTGHLFKWSCPRTRDTNSCSQAFSSGAVTTCFNDLCLSRPGIEPWSSACEANDLPRSHRGC